ncbi:MAG TPA: PASTA domain-containing protein [Catenuloplanes sp.]|jgi:biotin carboxyl carrier protein
MRRRTRFAKREYADAEAAREKRKKEADLKEAAEEKAEKARAAKEKVAEEKADAAQAAKRRKAAAKVVTMPNLYALKLDVAMRVAEKAGLVNAQVCSSSDGMVWVSKNWKVLTQSVSAGTRIRGGTEVCLGVIHKDDIW